MRIILNRRRQVAGFFALMVGGALASVAGSAVSAAGAERSAAAQQQASKYNAAVQTNNASVAIQQAKFDSAQIQEQTARRVGQQRAAMASSGFDANSGSFTDVTLDTQRKGELEKLSRIYQGQIGVMRDQSAATLDTMQGQAASTAGAFGAASSLLGGISQATQIGARAYTYSNNNNPSF